MSGKPVSTIDEMPSETRRAYTREFSFFEAWCRAERRSHLPATPETVAEYVHALAEQGRKAAGIDLALSAIARMHAIAGHVSPRHHQRVKDARATVWSRPGQAKVGRAPMRLDALRAGLATLPAGPIGARDRSLLLLCWAAALRRSEVVGLDLEHVRIVPQGIEVRLTRSKTDQEGAGQDVDIYRGERPETCPVRALEAWLAVRGSAPGPLFVGFDGMGRRTSRRMHGSTVAKLVKRVALAAGLDAAEFAGHSLRRGLIQQAVASHVKIDDVAEFVGHTSLHGTVPYLTGMGEEPMASKSVGL